MKDLAPTLADPAPRTMCTDCGLSRTGMAHSCGKACQFIKPEYPASEKVIHGRKAHNDGDELFFGVTKRMYKASLKAPRESAQWTGITTRLAERLLEDGLVDAVLTVEADPDDKWKPKPVLLSSAGQMHRARGMRMGYAPLLALLEPAMNAGLTRLAVIGLPCQVYALRQIEAELGLDRLYVIGTPCSDNTTTENFHGFLARLTDAPETVTYLEFRADYHVELRFQDGTERLIPFLKLPISDLPNDFFPLTCRTCVDYTNRLSDITVGYMGGDGEQWILIRNDRGQEIFDLLGDSVTATQPNTAGKRAGSVKGFIENTRAAAGGLPIRRMPSWVRPIVSWLMPRIGPRGLEFARTRVEMKAAETVLHLEQQMPAKVKNMVPDHIWKLVEPYGLQKSEKPGGQDANNS